MGIFEDRIKRKLEAKKAYEIRPVEQFQGPYRFLSNFWPAEIKLDGVTYPTVEHAYQAAKFYDKNIREIISSMASPGQAKRASRCWQREIRSDWDNVKLEVMEDLIRQKFTCHPELKNSLLLTGKRILQEGNKWKDTFWGVDIKTGEGFNHLGLILMKIREELRNA